MAPLDRFLVGYASMFLQLGVLALLAALAVVVRVALRRPALDGWTLGLAAYAGGLAVLAGNVVARDVFGHDHAELATTLYAALEDLAPVLFIAALRAERGARPAVPAALTALLVLAVVSTAGVTLTGVPFLQVFIVHSGWLAVFYAVTVAATRPLWRNGPGAVLACAAFVALTLDYAHVPLLEFAGIRLAPTYVGLESYGTVVLDIVLGMAAVLRTTDGIRATLERRNAELASAESDLRRTAFTDALCGIPNRASLLETLSAPPPFGACAMIDLDGLKDINDRCGHPAGDAALIAVARALLGRVGTEGMIFRIGGDEFAAVWTRLDAALAAARLDEAAHDLGVLAEDGAAGPLRISYGTAAFGPELGLLEALARADAALYARKAMRG